MSDHDKFWSCDICKKRLTVRDLNDIGDGRVRCKTCAAEADILAQLQKGAIPNWAAPHFKDYAKQAVENLIKRGLAERKPDGSIAARKVG